MCDDDGIEMASFQHGVMRALSRKCHHNVNKIKLLTALGRVQKAAENVLRAISLLIPVSTTPTLITIMVASVKVFKKTSPNGKLTVYLGKRDFVDQGTHVDPIEGVVVADPDYLKGRKVFSQVKIKYISFNFLFH